MTTASRAGRSDEGQDMDAHFYSEGTVIAGTLAEVAQPVAAALLITGSGRINRDSDARLGRRGPVVLRTGVTRQVAEALGAANVVTLRYDKRGIGASGGDYLRAGLTENLADARAALRWLAARFPGLPLLTVGHSEGTWHAARLAADGEPVAGTVLLSAPARTGEEVVDWQIAVLAPTLPRPVRLILRLTRQDFARTQHKRVAMLKASKSDVIRVGGVRANARWWREFLDHDPAPDYARIAVPVLAVTGGHDMQVSPEDVAAIGRLVKGPFDGRVIGDLSHLLRPDPNRKGPVGYRRALRQPVSAEVLALITGWVAGILAA
ncbi:MAG: serine aminopeptidase domain-containing protein [Trebonia sp.]